MRQSSTVEQCVYRVQYKWQLGEVDFAQSGIKSSCLSHQTHIGMLFLYNLHDLRSGSRPSRTFLTLKFFPEHTKTSPTRANSAAAWGNFRLVANRVLKVMK